MNELTTQESLPLVEIGETRVRVASNTRGLIIPDDITWDEAEQTLDFLYTFKSTVSWGILDMFAACEYQWGETYAQLIDETKLSYRYLSHMAAVHRRFPTPEHRRWNLSITHYAAVTRKYLSDEDAERLLNAAEREGLSVAVLEGMVRGITDIQKTGTSFTGPMFVQSIESVIDYMKANSIRPPDNIWQPFLKYLDEYRDRINRGRK